MTDQDAILRHAVSTAAEAFKRYAESHRAKGTAEGDVKAAANEKLLAQMLEALHETTPKLPDVNEHLFDAIRYGLGVTQGGKRIPAEQFFADCITIALPPEIRDHARFRKIRMQHLAAAVLDTWTRAEIEADVASATLFVQDVLRATLDAMERRKPTLTPRDRT